MKEKLELKTLKPEGATIPSLEEDVYSLEATDALKYLIVIKGDDITAEEIAGVRNRLAEWAGPKIALLAMPSHVQFELYKITDCLDTQDKT